MKVPGVDAPGGARSDSSATVGRVAGVGGVLLGLAAGLGGCGDGGGAPDAPAVTHVEVQPLWNQADTSSFAECMFASPQRYEGAAGSELIVTAGDVVAGLSPGDGSVLWSVTLPGPEGTRALVAATPLRRGDLLVVVFQSLTTDVTTNALDPETPGLAAADGRSSHWAVVVDLASRSLHPDYAPLRIDGDVEANDAVVAFNAPTQFSRADVKWLPSDDGSGWVIITYGNVRDLQPWHGWAFAVDLDAWRADVSGAITGAFVTTPEADCGTPGASGSTQRVCGGGLWAPSGPLVVEHDGTASLVLAPGNGQLDLDRGDYANTLLRLTAELVFDPGCDESACADFDADAPDEQCIATCERMFVPRPLPGEPDPSPASGICDGLPFFECWQQLDYIGGSTPAYLALGGRRLLAYPTKDGYLYLVDFDHLGTMFDRHQLVEYCGTAEDACRWSWAGMIVTQPASLTVDGEARLVVPTFMPDNSHPAGVVSVAVVEVDGVPRLERRWEYPPFDSAEAVTQFRVHPSRPALAEIDGRTVVLVVEPKLDGSAATLQVLDAADGSLVARQLLHGAGYRFTMPLVDGTRVYVNSCEGDRGRGALEAWELVVTAASGAAE